MSGRRSESQATRLSRRCLIELTFQVATSMADPALREGDQGRLSREHFPPKAWPGLDPGWAPVRRRKSIQPDRDAVRVLIRPIMRPGSSSGACSRRWLVTGMEPAYGRPIEMGSI